MGQGTLSWFERFIADTNSVEKYSLTQYANSLKRDLEDLLNTPRQNDKTEGCILLNTSLFNYGVPVFSENILASDADFKTYCQDLVQTLTLFEPRLTAIKIEPTDVKIARGISLLVTALLVPASSNLKLASKYSVVTGHFTEFRLYYER